MLQLLQYKDRNEQRPLKKARLADVRDAAVDDDARIEQLVLPVLLPIPHRQRHGGTHIGAHADHLAQKARNEVKDLGDLLLFLHHDVHTEIPDHNAEHDGDVVTDNGNRRKCITKEACYDKSDKKSNCPGNHIACRHLRELPLHPDGETAQPSGKKWSQRIADQPAEQCPAQNAEQSRKRQVEDPQLHVPERRREIGVHRRNGKLKDGRTDDCRNEYDEKA